MEKFNEIERRLQVWEFSMRIAYDIPVRGKWIVNVYAYRDKLLFTIKEDFIEDLLDGIIVELNRRGYD